MEQIAGSDMEVVCNSDASAVELVADLLDNASGSLVADMVAGNSGKRGLHCTAAYERSKSSLEGTAYKLWEAQLNGCYFGESGGSQ